MKKKHLPVFLLFGIIVMASSCAKEGPSGPTGPVGPSFTGNIAGHVTLYDQYGSKVLTGLDKVLLSLNYNNPVYPDSTGYYDFITLVTGYFNLGASDSGYGATFINNFQLVGGSLNKDIKLSAIPVFPFDTLLAFHNAGSPFDSLVITLTPDIRDRSCIVFVNKTPAVNNLPAGYLLNYIKTIPANATSVTLLIPGGDLTNAGISSGSMVYYEAYNYVVNDASVYEDVTTGKNIYNSVNYGRLDSAVAP